MEALCSSTMLLLRVVSLQIQALAYNTKKLKREEAPKSWEDVTNPKYKGIVEKYSCVHMTSFPFEWMIALMHMIGEGVFDRYPKLRVGFMEGACGWLPFWSERLDEHFHKLRPQWPLL
ncbi:MAG TPA: ABC transporter substrate-binding protein [Candidatus Binatia bacterium]|jgi:spermidine/putrescine-binding protein|nr:ABC transporter substrate-binding protein [Candidatus Binatia bacterium]